MFTYDEARAAAQTAVSSLTRHCRRGAQLWLSEARATVPAAWLARFGQLAQPVLTLTLENGAVGGLLEGGTAAAEIAWPAQEVSIERIVGWLEALQLSRDEVRIQVALEAEKFLHRKMLVPKAALGSLQSIIAQEVVHRMPFEPAEIWHTARAGAAASGSDIIEVQHWIIRRDRACEALNQFGLRPEQVDALVVRGCVPLSVIALREPRADDPIFSRRLIRMSAVAAIAITLFGAIAIEWFATSKMNHLDEALAQFRGQGVGGETAAQLVALRAAPGMVQVWEELSRVLPDHTYLSELRVAAGNASISGFSGDGAHLIRLFDQSALFAGARLAGAITPDKTEHKDRFSLTFRLRGAQKTADGPSPVAAWSQP